MERMFRLLHADEIEVRISQITNGGIMLLLYKDARCDQNILDETVGPMNWQRHHSRDNKNCTVSIYDAEKKQWVEKEDTGTESNTEAEKGLASDSFKRACFNWGIGRELYSAPTMWFPRAKCNVDTRERNGRKVDVCYDRLEVTGIAYNEKFNIVYVAVTNKTTNLVHEWGEKPVKKREQKAEEPVEKQEQKAEEPAKKKKKTTKAETQNNSAFEQNKITVQNFCKRDGIQPDMLAAVLHKNTFDDLTDNQITWCLNTENWNRAKEAVRKMLEGDNQNVPKN